MEREVSEAEFYAALGPRDVLTRQVGGWPYVTEFYPRHNRHTVVGRREPVDRNPWRVFTPYRYYLTEGND